MKKKLISVLLSAAMATTMLAGCGSTAADTGAAPAETKATEEKTEAADTEAETGTEEAVEVLARIHRKMKQRKTIPRVLFIT